MRAAAALAIVALLPTPNAHALCVTPQPRASVLNDNVAAPADGGLVVAMTYDGGGDDVDDEAQQKVWTFKTGKTAKKPVLATLAPGLVVYALPGRVAAADLHDGKRARGHITRSTAKVAVLAAPKVKAIEYTVTPGRRGNTTSTTVLLDGDQPADAIAMIVFDAKTGAARSFGAVQGDAVVNVYYQGRCSALPNGTVETKAGDRVTLRWVDKLGRLSAPTNPISVTKG